MALNTLGKSSKTVFLAKEGEKLSAELIASAAIKKGQPIKLGTTGQAAIWAKADGMALLLGYALSDAASGEYVTVICRGYAMVYGLSKAAQNAGAVVYDSYNTTTAIQDNTGYSVYAALGSGDPSNAIALDDAGAAGELIRVILMD